MDQASAGLEKIVIQSLRLAPPAQAPLLAWPLVCGSSVAERTRAVSFQAGVLRVQVADMGWKSGLQTFAPHYVAGINKYTTEVVSKIEFLIGPSQLNHIRKP